MKTEQKSTSQLKNQRKKPPTQIQQIHFHGRREQGLPVYFLGDLVRQADVARPLRTPNSSTPMNRRRGEEPRYSGWRGTRWQFGAMLLDTVGLKKSPFSFPSCTQLCPLLHARLLHAEGDLGVLVAEQDVCNARGRVAGRV